MPTVQWLFRVALTAVCVLAGSAQLALAETLAPTDHCIYVAPKGTPQGDGSAEKPLDITTAFSAQSPVKPGETILLLPGSYEGPIKDNSIERLPFNLAVNGTPQQPIYIMTASGAMAPAPVAHLNGSLNISGSNLCVAGLEIGDLTWDLHEITRKSAACVQIVSPSKGVRIINCNLFGGWNGIYALQGEDNEFYGDLVHDFGSFKGHNAPGGSAFYIHNDGEGRKVISNCATYRTGALNIAPHGVRGKVKCFDITQNFMFLAGGVAPHNSYENLMVNTAEPMDDIHITGNVLYQNEIVGHHKANVRLSNFKAFVINKSIEFSDNEVFGNNWGLRIATWEHFTAVNNTVWAKTQAVEISSATIGDGIPTQQEKPNLANYTLKNNTYFGAPDAELFRYSNTERDQVHDNYTFAQWQKLGIDADSKLLPLKDDKPTGTKTIVLPNKYQQGRAQVAAINWDGKNEFMVNLDSVLKPGSKYVVYHMLDITQTIAQAKPLISGVYDGKPVKFPARKDPTSPEFEAYLVLQTQ